MGREGWWWMKGEGRERDIEGWRLMVEGG